MKKLLPMALAATMMLSIASMSMGQENRVNREILQRAVESIGRMERAQEYSVASKVWLRWEDEPDEYNYQLKWLVLSVPEEPYTQSKYVRWDENGFDFGYDGEKRVRPRNDGKDSLYEVDYKFKHPEAPRIRVVPKPFFQTACDIINYVLHSPDSMKVQWLETPTHYELHLITLVDPIMTFCIGHLDPHGYPRTKLGRVIDEESNEWYHIRLDKTDLLPCEIIASPNPTQIHKMTLLSRRALAIDTLDIMSFLPDGYRIYKPKSSDKPKPQVTSIGQPLPDFTAVDTEGKTYRRDDYKGKTLLLVHSAINCGACQAAVPTLDSLYAALPHDKVEILALSAWQEKLDVMRSYRKRKGFAYPYALAQESDSLLMKLSGKTSAPQFTLVDAQGIVRRHLVGYDKEKLLKFFSILANENANSRDNLRENEEHRP